MTKAFTVHTVLEDDREAGRSLARDLLERFDNSPPDAVILFASARYDHEALLSAFNEVCAPRALVGCSSAAEFVKGHEGDGTACAIGLQSSEIRFNAVIGHGVRDDEESAALTLVSKLEGLTDFQYPFRSALILSDALAGQSAILVRHLDVATDGMYKFFGGAASDNVEFRNTPVFCDGRVYNDAVVALEILSTKPVGVGVAHGWTPVSEKARVTEADGKRVVSISSGPAVEIYEDYAKASGQDFDRNEPLPFLLHNVLGIQENDRYRIRVPVAVNDDGSLNCATEVPEGALVKIMGASGESTFAATREAVRRARSQLKNHEPCVALFFDCIATRIRLGKDGASHQLEAMNDVIGEVEYAGFNSYGQIVRADGQHDGFHNCTALVCLLPA